MIQRVTWFERDSGGGSTVHREPAGSAGGFVIRTLEGDMRVNPGDWVVRGVQGEYYPVKPDIFSATYEPA